MNTSNTLILGSRGSALALVQANLVKTMLQQQYPTIDIVIDIIKTTGDQIQDKPLYEIGGKALFVKEIEQALLDGRIDVAVHSLKDVPGDMPEIFSIAGVLPREDASDALICKKARSIAELPSGATLGTSSPRRAAQALKQRPDLRIVSIRGNVQTRLQKILDGDIDATFLACAGLNRLNITHACIHTLDHKDMLPAVGQGIIGLQIANNRKDLQSVLEPINDVDSFVCATAERQFLQHLEGSCRSPIAALATITSDKQLLLEGMVLSQNGTKHLRQQCIGSIASPKALGDNLASVFLEQIDWSYHD